MNLEKELKSTPNILLKKSGIEAGIAIVILFIGLTMESLYEGQGFLRLTIFCVFGLSIHLSCWLLFIFKHLYYVTEGEVAEIKILKTRRKWWKIDIKTSNGDLKQMIIPIDYAIKKGKYYRFYSKNEFFLGAEEIEKYDFLNKD